jgi:hypothetical protein
VTTALERVAIVVTALALAVAVIALLSGGLFTGSDKPELSGAPTGPGQPARLAHDDPLARDLRLGDVALIYGTPKPPPGLAKLSRALAAPVPPASGQAIVMTRRAGTRGVIGLAWNRLIRVETPNDPRLRAFVNFWLGRGASR